MAPEQLLGQPLDGRADLFSLGVVLWELLTWRPLFNRPTTQELAAVMLGGDIERPSGAVPRGAARRWRQSVLRALDRDPAPAAAPGAATWRASCAGSPRLPDQARQLLGQVLRAAGATDADARTPRRCRAPSPRSPSRRRPPALAPPAAPTPVTVSPGGVRVRGLVWTLVVAALAFFGGVKWAGRQQPVARHRWPRNGLYLASSGRGARIQPLPGKKIILQRATKRHLDNVFVTPVQGSGHSPIV